MDFFFPNCKVDLIKRLCLFFFNSFQFTTQSRLLTTCTKKPFKNIVGKGENTDNVFLPYHGQKPSFQHLGICRLRMLSNWTSLFFLPFDKELTLYSIDTHFDTDSF